MHGACACGAASGGLLDAHAPYLSEPSCNVSPPPPLSLTLQAGSLWLGTFDFEAEPYEWGEDYARPGRPLKDLVIYELCVRAFTADPSSGLPDPVRGTFRGVAEKVRCGSGRGGRGGWGREGARRVKQSYTWLGAAAPPFAPLLRKEGCAGATYTRGRQAGGKGGGGQKASSAWHSTHALMAGRLLRRAAPACCVRACLAAWHEMCRRRTCSRWA